MRKIKIFSTFNFIFLLLIGSYMSYYGLFVGESNKSLYVAYCGALLIAYAFHSTAIVFTSYRDKKSD